MTSETAAIRYDSRGLVPAVVQDNTTGEVLMVAWMNDRAVQLTAETGEVHFWSRSRQELWHKGATSGNFLNVRDILVDCDADTLLVKVDPEGPACHTGERSCFHRRWQSDSGPNGYQAVAQTGGSSHSAAQAPSEAGIVRELFGVILDREECRPHGSYTAELFAAGEVEILKKVGEEAIEVILAAGAQGNERLVSEIADLAYHLLVLMAARDLDPAVVEAELVKRRR